MSDKYCNLRLGGVNECFYYGNGSPPKYGKNLLLLFSNILLLKYYFVSYLLSLKNAYANS